MRRGSFRVAVWHDAAMSVTPAVPAPDSDAERRAVELRGFGLASLGFALLITLTSGIVIPPMIALNLGGLFVLLWRQASRTPVARDRLRAPRSWPLTIAGGIVFGVAFKLLMKAIVMPLLGADPVNHAYHVLAGNLAIIPAALWTLTTVGFNEETVWRGYYFERLGKLWGTSAWAKAATVLVTSFFFALAHFQDQGLAGRRAGRDHRARVRDDLRDHGHAAVPHDPRTRRST